MRHVRSQGGRGAATAAFAAALVICLLAPAGALAGTTGGTTFTLPPAISGVDCLTQCQASTASHGRTVVVSPGATVRVRGHNLENVSRVLFLGSSQRADDTTANVVLAGSTPQVTVPKRAQTGRVVVVNDNGIRSKATPPW